MENEEHTDEGEEFSIDNTEMNKGLAIQKIKEFSLYLTENVENNLSFCLKLLEERDIPKKSNSDPVTAFSMLTSPIPYVGKGLSSALKEGETFILNKIDKKNSRILADLVFYYSDNKETVRQMLIQSSMDLFFCFESQFLKLSCDGGSRRAMQKLAKDAANRIFTYFLKTKPNKEICKHDFSKGVIYGGSLKNKIGVKSGKTVEHDEQSWKTSNIYEKVGLFIEENGDFLKSKQSESQVYGYRRVFDWENLGNIRETWTKETPLAKYHYNLEKEDLVVLYPAIREYIMTKNTEEESKLDREKRHEESMEDLQKKHQETMETFMEKFGAILEDLYRNYSEIRVNHHQGEKIIEKIEESQKIEVERHQEISEKLTEIHKDVRETKDGQVQLQETTEDIKQEICVIKSSQSEISNTAVEVKKAVEEISVQKSVTLSDLVKDNYEVKKVARIVNEIKESIEKSDLEPKVRKEVQRTTKKIRKLFR